MNITITRTVTVQIELDEISIDQAESWMKLVEEKLSEALKNTGREMISEAFRSIIASKAPTKGIKEWASKWVKTLWGDIRVIFPRPRGTAFPKLRIPAVTPCVGSMITRTCAVKSFRQAERTISDFRGFRIPRSTLWKEFQRRSEALPELPDVETYPAEQVIIEADGTMIALQNGKKAEAKLVLAFSERKGHRLLDKVVYASMEPADIFNQKASQLVRHKYWVDMNTKGVVIGDGAPWIESLRDENFPQMRFQLDMCHVIRRARELLSSLDEKEREASMEDIRLSINTGNWEGFRHTMIKAAKVEPTRLGLFWEWMMFVKRNWKHLIGFLDYWGPLAENTSSPCEKHIDLVINRRLKIPGASWSIRGANNMLRVRNQLFNEKDDHNQE